jgi:bifunctional non-homologous end joining protein LigD
MSRSGAPSRTVAGVRLTHPDRVLYADQGITKADLAAYYEAVADWILPHVQGRPLSLVRCPEGEGGACFYQKHFPAGPPKGLKGATIREKEGRATYATITDLGGLVALVQLGVLEIHPWGSTVEHLENPDLLILDLDPDPDLPWSTVSSAALEAKKLLKDLGLASFAKLTGGKGLHVTAPLLPRDDWDTLKSVARALAERLAAQQPSLYTTGAAKEKRSGRIFIDYLRNARGQTAVAPYSPRARAGAPVATPVAWSEVAAGIRPNAFTVATLPKRLAQLERDPWAGMMRSRQRLSDALKRELRV